jgi:exodeoxyribonuclease VII small subunit
MPKAPPSAAAGTPATYEQAVAELEQLVQAMEDAQLPLDQLLQHYQRSAELLGYCRGKLEAVEQQVKVLEEEQFKSWDAQT